MLCLYAINSAYLPKMRCECSLNEMLVLTQVQNFRRVVCENESMNEGVRLYTQIADSST